MAARAILLVFVCLFLAVSLARRSKRALAKECNEYCSGTYPEHTYPCSDNHDVCRRGCRLAQMDALIAWPQSPCENSCKTTCIEAYPNSPEAQFACSVGCNASTLHTLIPDRAGIYSNDSFDDVFMQLWNVLTVFVETDRDRLTDHAKDMAILIPSFSASEVYITDGENGEIIYYFEQVMVTTGDSSEDDIDNNIYDYEDNDTPPSSYCPWRRFHGTLVGRFLMAASFWLLVFSCLLCGCILFGAHSQEEDTCSKKEKSEKLRFYNSRMVSEMKVPLDFTYHPEAPLFLPVQLGTGEEKTVEGILTVV